MRKALKVLGWLLLCIVLLVSIALAYIKTALPSVGAAPNLKIAVTPEKIERGRYLANSVTVCMDCHSTRDWTKFAGPLTEGTLGRGGEKFDQQAGFPGIYYSKNITPAGISRYTDGELFRLITTGVTKEGRAMFPVMPYGHYGKMDPSDIESIIAYIRSLPPIQSNPPESKSDFPMNFIINTIPKKAVPGQLPAATDTLAYGKYMVNASACIECHTPVDKGQIIEKIAFSGGRAFSMPAGVIRSANITPDAATGIGSWTEDMFVKRFKMYADSAYHPALVKDGEFNSIMPWMMYSNMKPEDLSAIYKFLRTVQPIQNKVVKFGGKVAVR